MNPGEIGRESARKRTEGHSKWAVHDNPKKPRRVLVRRGDVIKEADSDRRSRDNSRARSSIVNEELQVFEYPKNWFILRELVGLILAIFVFLMLRIRFDSRVVAIFVGVIWIVSVLVDLPLHLRKDKFPRKIIAVKDKIRIYIEKEYVEYPLSKLSFQRTCEGIIIDDGTRRFAILSRVRNFHELEQLLIDHCVQSEHSSSRKDGG